MLGDDNSSSDQHLQNMIIKAGGRRACGGNVSDVMYKQESVSLCVCVYIMILFHVIFASPFIYITLNVEGSTHRNASQGRIHLSLLAASHGGETCLPLP